MPTEEMPTTACAICGESPVGTGCYHICPNSVHYYSAEQERYDDATNDGSDDRRERYAAEAEDMRREGEMDAAYYAEQDALAGDDPLPEYHYDNEGHVIHEA